VGVVYDHMCQQQCDQRIGYAAGFRPGNMSLIGARSAYLALRDFDPANVSCGSTTVLTALKRDFCSTPINGHRQTVPTCLKGADIVAKVFLRWRTKIIRAADAFYTWRREGPYRFIQDRSRAFVVTLKSDAAAEKSNDQLSRDF
jgi:hypothetical protein